LSLTAYTLWGMTAFTNDTPATTIVFYSMLQGFGFGLVFVPLNTVSFLTLPQHLRTDGASILTLIRNIASAIGISAVIAELTRNTTANHARLTEFINPFNFALQFPNVSGILDLSTDAGRALAEQMVSLQAQILAYSADFWLIMVLTLASLPLAAVIGSSRRTMQAMRQAPAPTEVME
jgi:DHA2 family multidrug resistance protein